MEYSENSGDKVKKQGLDCKLEFIWIFLFVFVWKIPCVGSMVSWTMRWAWSMSISWSMIEGGAGAHQSFTLRPGPGAIYHRDALGRKGVGGKLTGRDKERRRPEFDCVVMVYTDRQHSPMRMVHE
jgi:hypothetical protein